MNRVLLSCLLLLFAVRLTSAYAQDDVQAQVRPFELNVRAMPGTSGALLGVFKQGSAIVVHGREDQPYNGVWVYAEQDGLAGWVLSDYLIFPAGFDVNSLAVLGSGGAPAPASNNVPANTVPTGSELLSGKTTTIVNFRSGPSLGASVIRILPTDTQVGLMGQTADGAWLQAVVDGQSGWLFATYIRVSGDENALPVVDEAARVSAGNLSPGSGVVPVGVVPVVGARAREIFLAGQKLGNRADVFSKVGDSITARNPFLFPIADGGLQLHSYASLQPVVDYFSRTPARTHNSFGNISLAAYHGWTSSDVLNPSKNLSPDCRPDESPLACEYRLVKPALALIMIGTNDAQWGVPSDVYQRNLMLIVETSIQMGVIPIVSTLPDNVNAGGRVHEFNAIIRSVAAEYDIPLWDYWLALQGLPNRGLDPDGIHPSMGTNETAIFSDHDVGQYGYTMRNLTALMVLDAVWRGALY